VLSFSFSELELAAAIVHEAALLSAPPVTHPVTCLSGSDNTPAVSWLQRASLTSLGPAAALLHLRSRLRRAHQLNASIISVPGVENVLADFASRAFHLSDDALLHHFASSYPFQASWQLLHPPPDLCSYVISALLRNIPQQELLLPEHDPLLACGKSGVISVPQSTLTHPPVPGRPDTVVTSLRPFLSTGRNICQRHSCKKVTCGGSPSCRWPDAGRNGTA